MVRPRYATQGGWSGGWAGGWPHAQPYVFLVFSGVAILFAVASGRLTAWVPAASAVLLVMLAGYFMQLRYLLLFYTVLVPCVVVSALLRDRATPITPGIVGVIVLSGVLMALFVRTRESLGVQGNTGQRMLVDLRDRLRAQALPARMPDGVRMEVAQRSANGEGFSGDFVLSAVRPEAGVPDWPGALEVVVVDVSGKGQAVGTRALLLSGGMSGLVCGSRVPEFLPAANSYLLRQEWAEGFATALHLVLDPRTGSFVVRSAGHPPPLQHHAGSGRWQVVQTVEEPPLGLLAEGRYGAVHGRLGHGDALVLYSDGVVDNRGRDLSYGVDRLSGQLARHVQQGYAGAAEAGIDAPRAGGDDDRTVVVLWRT